MLQTTNQTTFAAVSRNQFSLTIWYIYATVQPKRQ